MSAQPQRIAETPVAPGKPPERHRPATSPQLEFRLLGPLEVHRVGEPVALGGARQRALLALLCLHCDTVVAVDRIVDELWGESPPRTARHMVEVYVSKLRKLIGAEALVTCPPGYRLQVGPERVDIARFERLLTEGRDTLAAGDPAFAAAKLADALTLWRGPPLGDFAYEPFAQAEIARLEELRLLAQEAQIEADLELGKSAELVSNLEDLVARAPFRERFRAQLMLALYRAGRQADALAAYRAARETLVEELGVEPSSELRDLERAILAQDEGLAASRGPGVPAAPETRRVVTIAFVEPDVGQPGLDPEAFQAALERSLERAERVLTRHGAAVERAPDGTVMAVFGSPVAHEDDAARSLHAAAELQELGLVSRAAVDTGEVLAGGDQSVRGPVVRAAAQLLAVASPEDVLAGELTRQLAAESAHFEAVEADARCVWRVHGVTPGAPRAVRLDVPAVGRREELAELRSALARTVDERRPGLVTVVGEPGIGKSRLAREFGLAAQPKVRVLIGRCLAYGDGITYWPLREVIGELAPHRTVEELEALLDGVAGGKEIARRLASTIGLLDETYPVEEIRWAARRLFETLARERPLVLLLEDVHWAEQTFLDLVQHVLESGDAPILVLCLARPELLEEHPGWEVRNEHSSILALEPLTADEAAELISRLDSAGTLSPKHRERVFAVAGGNPLFVEQLVALAAEIGHQAEPRDVPATLQALLAARLDRLGPGERAVVACAAVVGREFSAEAVKELLPPGARPTAHRHMDTLERRNLIEAEPATLPFEHAFCFRHMLIQETAYRSLPKERRAELHERLAEWVERTPAALRSDQEEIIGYHLEQAYLLRTELGRTDGARVVALRAGEKLSVAGEAAFARNDLPAAATLLARATRLLQAAHHPRFDLLVDLGAALYWIGEGPQALGVLDEAFAQARSVGDTALEWRARLTRDYVYRALEPRTGSLEEDLRTSRNAVAALERLGEDRALARAWRAVAQSELWLGRHENSLEAAARTVEHARRAGDRQEEALAFRIRSMALSSGPTPAAQAAQGCEELLATAPNREAAAHVLGGLGEIRARQGQLVEARHLVDDSLAIFEELGLTFWLAATLTAYSAQVHYLASDLPRAEQDLRRALELYGSMDDSSGRSTAAVLLAHALYDAGRYSEAEHCVGVAEALAMVDDYFTNAKLQSARAKVLARRGQFDDARDAAESAIKIIDATDDLQSRGEVWLDKADILIVADDFDGATTSLLRAIELLEKKGDVVLAGRARAKLFEIEGTSFPR